MDVRARGFGIWVALWMMGCGSNTEPAACTVEFPDSVCLDATEAGALASELDLVETEVGRTLDAVAPLIDVSGTRILIIADPSGVIPEIGFGGFNPSSHEVHLFADPGSADLRGILRAQLMPILAHELHHAARRRTVGYGATLLEAAVTEGLADHFSLQVSPGAPPPWSTALSAEELAAWVPEVVARSTGTYDHPEWFFGTGPSAPRWTGYAVGFELVRDYLQRYPERRPSDLVDEPAEAFVPDPT
jgi:hypothetical protein